MIQDDIVFTVVVTVVSCLPPVDYMRIIGTCTYLYRRYRDKIPEKRRESLVKFVNKCGRSESAVNGYVPSAKANVASRGYKLPNGNLEGIYEELYMYPRNVIELQVSTYVNGKELSFDLYSMEGQNTNLVLAEFVAYQHIDITNWTDWTDWTELLSLDRYR